MYIRFPSQLSILRMPCGCFASERSALSLGGIESARRADGSEWEWRYKRGRTVRFTTNGKHRSVTLTLTTTIATMRYVQHK